MIEKDRKKILRNAIKTFGTESQMMMAIEEMAELTKALCKWSRAKTEADLETVMENIVEELADVGIMMEQLTMMFEADDAVTEIAATKLKRLEDRVAWARTALDCRKPTKN